MLAAISQARDFAGLATRRATAIVLTEEPRAAFREKLQRFGLGNDAGAAVFWAEHYATPWPELLAEAADAASAQAAEVLVVDTSARFAGLTGDQENHAGAVLEALAPANIAAQDKGLAVVLLAHRRKSPGEYGTGVRGSSAIIGSVDIVAEYEPPSQGMRAGPSTRIIRTHSRYATTPD